MHRFALRWILLLVALIAVTGCRNSGYFLDDHLVMGEEPPEPPTPDPSEVDYSFWIVIEDIGNIRGFLPNIEDALPWVRLAGAGIDDMGTRQMRGALFDLGKNGTWDQGLGDDIEIREVSDVQWSITAFEVVEIGDGGAPTIDDTGLFTAGSDTGTATVLGNNGTWGDATVSVLVTAPDWCPGENTCLPE